MQADKENSPTETQVVQPTSAKTPTEKPALGESNTNTALTGVLTTSDGVLKETAPKTEEAPKVEESKTTEEGSGDQIKEKQPKKKEPDFFNNNKKTSLQDHFGRFRKAKK